MGRFKGRRDGPSLLKFAKQANGSRSDKAINNCSGAPARASPERPRSGIKQRRGRERRAARNGAEVSPAALEPRNKTTGSQQIITNSRELIKSAASKQWSELLAIYPRFILRTPTAPRPRIARAARPPAANSGLYWKKLAQKQEYTN
ncbi:hypothetical protein EVAR_58500_1 [Eumeta japonica]|uniref:Uncharacterized protein n=1 Tax=Eumeta variegata TaxID=151549 RepID=A0A4C1ZAD3_EUMVA|nr:hypothetical protein EVAR_58500_1 [Eumeta japonica]